MQQLAEPFWVLSTVMDFPFWSLVRRDLIHPRVTAFLSCACCWEGHTELQAGLSWCLVGGERAMS